MYIYIYIYIYIYVHNDNKTYDYPDKYNTMIGSGSRPRQRCEHMVGVNMVLA